MRNTPHPEFLKLVPRFEIHPFPARGEGKTSVDVARTLCFLIKYQKGWRLDFSSTPPQETTANENLIKLIVGVDVAEW